MSPLQEALGNLDKYVPEYALGLLAATISDPIVTSLAIGTLVKDRRLKKFLFGYAACRTVNSVANAIVVGMQMLIQSQHPAGVLAPTP